MCEDEGAARELEHKRLMTLAAGAAGLAVSTRFAATLIVAAEVVSMLRRKGLLDDADIGLMLQRLNENAAGISTTAPEQSKCLADAALSLHDAFVEEAGKPN